MRQRLTFCLLLIGIMFYYAIPKLNFYGSIEEILFAASWLILALCAVAGNLAVVLYAPGRKRVQTVKKSKVGRKRVYEYE